MGQADYISRDRSEPAKPSSTYHKNFMIVQIDFIKEILQIVRERGRPKQSQNKHPSNEELNSQNDSKVNI